MGRSPCCDKTGLKKGPWTPEEDQMLIDYIQRHGHESWRALPQKAGVLRCGKSCRLRWTNYLRPDIKRGKFSVEEEQAIIGLHAILGNRWSAIASYLRGRTDNEIKNYWNTHLKKRLLHMGIDPVTHKPKRDFYCSADSLLPSSLNHIAQWENAKLHTDACLARDYLRLSIPSSESFYLDVLAKSLCKYTTDLQSDHVHHITTNSISRRCQHPLQIPAQTLIPNSASLCMDDFDPSTTSLLLDKSSQEMKPVENISPTSTLYALDRQTLPILTLKPSDENGFQCDKRLEGNTVNNGHGIAVSQSCPFYPVSLNGSALVKEEITSPSSPHKNRRWCVERFSTTCNTESWNTVHDLGSSDTSNCGGSVSPDVLLDIVDHQSRSRISSSCCFPDVVISEDSKNYWSNMLKLVGPALPCLLTSQD